MPILLAKAICVLRKLYPLDWCYFGIIELKRSVVMGLLTFTIKYLIVVKRQLWVHVVLYVSYFMKINLRKGVAFASERQSKSRLFYVLGLDCWTRWIYCGFRFGVWCCDVHLPPPLSFWPVFTRWIFMMCSPSSSEYNSFVQY